MNIFKKLKLLWMIIPTLKKIQKLFKGGTMKAGILTTEFWLSIAAIAANVWMAVQGFIPADLLAKIIAAVVMVYTVARAVVKFTPSIKDDELLAKIEALFKPKA